MRGKIIHVIHRMICALFIVVIIWLTAAAGFSTAYITSDDFEKTYLIADSIWINLLVSAAFFLFCVLYRKLRPHLSARIRFLGDEKRHEERVRKYLLLLIGVLGLVFVVASMRAPKTGRDQYAIVNAAQAWKRGDFSAITRPGSYLDRYPNQWGIILLLYGLSFIFGEHNYLACQLMNVLCTVWFYCSMAELADRVSQDGGKKAGNALLILGVLFFPLILYTTYVYGNLAGLALSAAALLKLDDVRRQFRVWPIVQACLMLMLAVIIKQNYLIFALGFMVTLALVMIREANWKLCIPCLGLLVVMLFSSSIVSAVVTGISGRTAREDSGLSPLAWVDMGLQECKPEYRYDGWWTGYYTYDSYDENGYSRQAQKAVVTEEITKRLEQFRQDLGYTFRFFAGKNASQWNNPTFESFLLNKNMRQADEPFYSSKWVQRMFDIKETEKLAAFLNRFQFIVLMGAVFFALFYRNKEFISFSIFVVFLGGFVFHTVWEAKGQYTLPYFVMLFPLSVIGWREAVSACGREAVKFRETKKLSEAAILGSGIALLSIGMLAVIQSGIIPFFSDTVRLDRDAEKYKTYLAENLDYNTVLIKEGDYCISSAEDGSYLSGQPSEHDGTEILLIGSQDESTVIHVSHTAYDRDDYRLHFSYSDKSLDVSGGTANEGDKVWTYYDNPTDAQRWKFVLSDTAGAYFIYYKNDLYLTWDPESKAMTVSKKNDADGQLWHIDPVQENGL